MKILIIGIGSIGKRHLSNICSLGYSDIFAVSSKDILPDPFQYVPVYRTIEDAFACHHFDIVFICSPTAFHAKQLLLLLKRQTKFIYIEKPVSDSTEHVSEIMQLSSSYTNHIAIGYDLHFEPGFEKVKSLLEENAIGKVVSVCAFAGQYLPQWRPYENHREGMSAKVSTGGGVLLDLIHEFDYLYGLLGNINSVYCNTTNSGTLEIETEESADVLIEFENGITSTVHLDYLQPQLKRFAIFTGTQGAITWNLADRWVEYTATTKATNVYSYKETERNDRFVTIVKAFLENKNDERLVSLADGLKSLQVVLAAKKSAVGKRRVNINEIQF